MWIKRENDEAINLDQVQSIEKRHREKSEDSDELFWIKFWQIGKNSVEYEFNSMEELNNYHENLLFLIDAKEVSTKKDPLNYPER